MCYNQDLSDGLGAPAGLVTLLAHKAHLTQTNMSYASKESRLWTECKRSFCVLLACSLPHLVLLSFSSPSICCRWWSSAGSFDIWDLCAFLERGISLNRKLTSAYYIDYHSGIKLILWGINSPLLTSQFLTNWKWLMPGEVIIQPRRYRHLPWKVFTSPFTLISSPSPEVDCSAPLQGPGHLPGWTRWFSLCSEVGTSVALPHMAFLQPRACMEGWALCLWEGLDVSLCLERAGGNCLRNTMGKSCLFANI